MAYLSSFQTDIVHPFWHPTRLLGYYATIALMFGATTMLYSRWFKKEEKLHRYSDFTDMFLLVLIITIATTGIMVHFFRLAGLPECKAHSSWKMSAMRNGDNRPEEREKRPRLFRMFTVPGMRFCDF